MSNEQNVRKKAERFLGAAEWGLVVALATTICVVVGLALNLR